MKSLLPSLRSLACAALMAPAILWAQAPQPPEIAARNYLLVDVTAGQVLASKDIDAPVEQASLTKLMTGYLVFDALRAKKITLEQKLPVSERAWKMPGSRMFIDPKMQVPVDDLLKGMIVQSGNDATMALAEGVGGTAENFVRLMNEQAKALGMTGTSYKNPEGLTEPGHTTTAKDLATLATRLMQDFPQYMHYYATKQYRYEGTPASNSSNRNALLFRDPTVDGLKTGHTAAAGYCLVATAKRDFPNLGQRRLLSIVLGAASENARANESQKLLNWGYTAFDSVKLFDAGQAAATPAIWKGTQSTLKIGREQAIVITVPSGSAGKVSTEIVRQDPLLAPFTKGQPVGTLRVKLGEQQVAELPLVALEDVGQAGIFGRTWDAIRLWIK
ncbi:MAG TPA: D-alanyl-D-alanine carboxypeptidase family protein [Alicycliphilus sp.]|jgi:D-alanyl-D-alanine carboxypeptidase (penicillin-binding protein 5/6)|uniref:serine-type D-Ala-D-Ala carboxypeptidase n=1 Tax=Diaphorobacter limosus TaxID=3036128 RepID=A0ABZ0J106_9BURK|nr:D-alanyl-D-alanine carboxypeptidase family protein [Diaphorobacter sp. Y-1]MBP6754019.1 D-alanyl-D-alanine carboxypeptidase [Alicycliphilus sp.]MCA0441000.1 D-alanyl-D-alanine carboxypeptidase [Pseudomonadota bacterium]MBP7325186.1 D-alanyl-D-alanine carboxypeptidase [Alicycliphilus sp.]MBP8779088.1 D-alanyl-D-alanine carboxypeptidase [Alicycliphilus sp.]WOO31016.1 D-alanyl-D-alanine carboxypeptidase family protein [Diaphorobacter sp. Y-1]